MRAALSSILPPLFVMALLLGSWQATVQVFDIKAYLLPTPAAVLKTVDSWRTPDGASALWQAMLRTGLAALLGLGASLTIGTAVALAFARFPFMRRGVYPYTIFFQTVPVVAIAPLIVLWLGTGIKSVVVVAFVLSIFPVISNATQGLTRIDARLLELFESYGATRMDVLIKLRLPHSIPFLVAGARVASGLAVIGAIVGEFFVGYGTDHFGLGYQIQMTSGQMRTDRLFAAIGGSTALGLALFGAVGVIGHLVLKRWNPEHADQ